MDVLRRKAGKGYTNSKMCEVNIQFACYLDIAPNQMFSLYYYPIPGKSGLPLCQEHGRQLEMKEVVVLDQIATELAPPDHCWACDR